MDWLGQISSAGPWAVAVCLTWSVVCSLYAYVLATLALRNRQSVHLTHRFLWARVELKVDPPVGPDSQHETAVGIVDRQSRREQAAS